jgi:hypothetical protein
METFKIIVIIFFIIIIYQIYEINSVVFTKEKFEDSVDNFAGVDDENSLNTLAQLANQLMSKGGLVIPGTLTVNNSVKSTDIKTGPIICSTITVNSRDILGELDAINVSLNKLRGS